jgi:hypothetical protein
MSHWQRGADWQSAPRFILHAKVATSLICPFGDFHQVVSKLRLDRAVDFAYFAGENDLIEFGHHLSRAKFAQVASFLARGTLRVFAGDFGEVGARGDFGLELFTGFFCRNENVSGGGFFGHGFFLSRLEGQTKTTGLVGLAALDPPYMSLLKDDYSSVTLSGQVRLLEID